MLLLGRELSLFKRFLSKFLRCSCCLSTATAKAPSMATSDKLQTHHTDGPRTPGHLTPDTAGCMQCHSKYHLMPCLNPLHTAPNSPASLWGHCLSLLRTCSAPWWPLPKPLSWKYSVCLLGACYSVKEDPSLEQPIFQSNLSG